MSNDHPTHETMAGPSAGDTHDTPESGTVISLFPKPVQPFAPDEMAFDVHVGQAAPAESPHSEPAAPQDTASASYAPDDTTGHADPDTSERHAERTPEQNSTGAARLLVVGIGGAGCNIVNHMIESNMRGVEFLAVNTDRQALSRSLAEKRLTIGESLTRGMGAGGNPAIGQQAAQESYHDLIDAIEGADMVFITAGMGGGTGTGASPIVAQAAREVGALTLAVVTTPFAFERRRRALAEQGVAALRPVVDALIIIPNERLAQLVGRDTSIFEAYRMADEALRAGVQGLSDLITIPGLVNLDYADVRSIMTNAGSAYLASGVATGEGRAENALHSALTNPLLDVDITGARGLIFNVTGGDDLSMREVEQIANALSASVHPDANLIFGATYDPSISNTLKITVVATGFEPHVAPEARAPTWTPGRISMAPGRREEQPSVSVTGSPSQAPQPAPPSPIPYAGPLPQLSQPPAPNYGWGVAPPPPPYQTPPYQTPPVRQVGAPGPSQAPAQSSPSQPSGPPGGASYPGLSQPSAPPSASYPGAEQWMPPGYPQEQYAEDAEERDSAHAQDTGSHHGFWSRLFSSNPPEPPNPSHP